MFRLDLLQDLRLSLLNAHHHPAPSYLDTLHRHGLDRPCWIGLYVPDAVAVQAAVILLDQGLHGPQYPRILH